MIEQLLTIVNNQINLKRKCNNIDVKSLFVLQKKEENLSIGGYISKDYIIWYMINDERHRFCSYHYTITDQYKNKEDIKGETVITDLFLDTFYRGKKDGEFVYDLILNGTYKC